MLHYLQELFQALDIVSLLDAVLRVAAVLLCLTVHETCHGLAAYALGDPTAKSMHRLSLNPLHHIDWLGLFMMFAAGFGWAKPVPVDPRYFKKPKEGMALTALAGPVSNFLLALVALFLYYPLRLAESSIVMTIALMLYMVAVMSIGLGVFNLIPVPPLDGSKILLSFLPRKYEWKFAQYQQFIQFGLLILLVLGVLNTPIRFFVNIIYQGLASIVLAVLG